jgi:alanyl-tRNA synthetase
VRSTGEIGLFRIVHETGVAAGVRRIEAVTGPGAYQNMLGTEGLLLRVTELVKATPEGVVRRVEGLLDDVKGLEKRLAEAQRGGNASAQSAILSRARTIHGAKFVAEVVDASDVKSLQALGDVVREGLVSGVGCLAATHEDGKSTLLVVVTDDLRAKGVSANDLIKAIGARTGARGGGKPHMAQAGFPTSDALAAAIPVATEIVEAALNNGAA